MHFEEILDQAIAMLQRRGRVTYRALKRQFNLDDDFLEDLTVELIKGQRLARDEDGEVLVWTGDAASLAAPIPTPPPATSPAPLAYTPTYLVEKILTTRSALEGEHKQVTVLFADLKGSTELIRDLDPEAAQQLLDPALQRMMDAVHRFEGTVNQVLGDGIMALFGAPIAYEDHALRACYAALAMQTELRRYAEEVRRAQGLEVQLRVGLNSGDVVVRTIGNDLHMDYSAVGQTTHLAARMEQLATPGTIRLPAATLWLVEGLVRGAALGPIPVRGLTEPVECADAPTNGIQETKVEDSSRRENAMPQKPSVATCLETLVRQTHKSEAEILTLAFQTGLRQLWREHILGRYLCQEIAREEAVEAVGLPWVELAERQHVAMLEDLAWALEQ